MNEHAIFECLLDDNVILRICGIFECSSIFDAIRHILLDDPEYSVPLRKYRDFISDPKRFKRIATFKDADLEKKIHQTFRAQYLKDVVLARIIEEAHFSVLTSIVMFNQVEILNTLCKDQDFLVGM